MTPQQKLVLDLINKLNGAEFAGWFRPADVMAFAQIESAFRATASRYEPRLNESSYGLMQVLASTAASVDPPLKGHASAMYDPEIGLRTGMKVARLYYDQERAHFGREPTLKEWAASYNEGVGGAERDVAAGRDPDPGYTTAWLAARAYWDDALNVPAPAADPPYLAAVLALDEPERKLIQMELSRRGLYRGALDGIIGKLSRAALAANRRDTDGSADP